MQTFSIFCNDYLFATQLKENSGSQILYYSYSSVLNIVTMIARISTLHTASEKSQQLFQKRAQTFAGKEISVLEMATKRQTKRLHVQGMLDETDPIGR